MCGEYPDYRRPTQPQWFSCRPPFGFHMNELSRIWDLLLCRVGETNLSKAARRHADFLVPVPTFAPFGLCFTWPAPIAPFLIHRPDLLVAVFHVAHSQASLMLATRDNGVWSYGKFSFVR